ncbi:MAG: hypothetical protein Q8K75_08550 [Chlamydiales bacterium]|nr:hypothetical protein [Chlamydiales bacterium]
MKIVKALLVASLFTFSAANAGIIGVAGGGQIIASPPAVLDGFVTNDHQQGFNELQGVFIPAAPPTLVDVFSLVPPGTHVNSHMIFLNSVGPEVTQNGVTWVFDGNVLGVMSDPFGVQEFFSTPFLGSPFTVYPGAPFSGRGMEVITDSYVIFGNTLTVNMTDGLLGDPGDWIRVLTVVPEPGTYLILGGFLVLTLFAASRRRSRA